MRPERQGTNVSGHLPALDFSKVKGHRSVAECFCIEIFCVASNKDGHVVAFWSALVQIVAKLEVAVGRGQVLREPLEDQVKAS